MGHCLTMGCSELLGRVQGPDPPETPAILRYLKSEIADSGLLCIRQAFQYKQIATSKDDIKDLGLVEKTVILEMD